MTEPTPTVWEEFKRTTEELQLELHLARMEARDRWAALQPRLRRIGATLRELRDDVVSRAKA